MIARLTGIFAELTADSAVLDVAGVGYEVDVPMSTFYNLPGLGERVVLLTHFVVREDAQVLFGFLTHEERATFRLLVKISGVGPRTALSILSGLSVDDLAQAIALQESGRLVKVPGIGKKTAERLVVELVDKLPALVPPEALGKGAGNKATAAGTSQLLLKALVNMGYRPAEAERAVEQRGAQQVGGAVRPGDDGVEPEGEAQQSAGAGEPGGSGSGADRGHGATVAAPVQRVDYLRGKRQSAPSWLASSP